MKRVAEIMFVVLAVAVMPAAAETFTGCVERVIDGDTIVVGTNIVRLAEIDAPEMKDQGGPEAKQFLADIVLHRTVRVEWKRRGRYRRIIGQVYLHGEWTCPPHCDAQRNCGWGIGQVCLVSEPVRRSNEGEVVWVNLTMVAQGWARHFRR